ncbi:MAG: hypothetical protein JEY91_05135 [Spirochaetaceae bacterium]|nr:hypothetical protein [Spirochaetaceae bacterium]
MYVLKRVRDDILLSNEDDKTFRLLSEAEKKIILEILPQLNEEKTDSVRVEKHSDGLKVVIRKEMVK